MTVVEYSGGSTGAGLAFVCSIKGYNFRLVTADVFGKEKIDFETFGGHIFSKKMFQRRKIKSCKSSQTRFAKVARRSEPCSRR